MARGFRAAYDSAAFVLAVSFGTFVFAAAAWYLIERYLTGWGRFGAHGVTYYILWLLMCGAAHYAWRTRTNEYPAISDTFRCLKTLWLPATALFLADAFITAVIVGDIYVFASKLPRPLNFGWIVFAWLGFLWLLMLIYHPVLLSAQSMFESKPTPLVIIKKSFLLMADNFRFTLVYFIVLLSIFVISTLLVFVGHALVCFGLFAFLTAEAVRELFVRYDAVKDEPDEIIDTWEIKDPDQRRK